MDRDPLIKFFYINDILGEVELNAKDLQEASVEVYNRYKGFGEATIEVREYIVKSVSFFRVKENK